MGHKQVNKQVNFQYNALTLSSAGHFWKTSISRICKYFSPEMRGIKTPQSVPLPVSLYSLSSSHDPRISLGLALPAKSMTRQYRIRDTDMGWKFVGRFTVRLPGISTLTDVPTAPLQLTFTYSSVFVTLIVPHSVWNSNSVFRLTLYHFLLGTNLYEWHKCYFIKT